MLAFFHMYIIMVHLGGLCPGADMFLSTKIAWRSMMPGMALMSVHLFKSWGLLARKRSTMLLSRVGKARSNSGFNFELEKLFNDWFLDWWPWMMLTDQSMTISRRLNRWYHRQSLRSLWLTQGRWPLNDDCLDGLHLCVSCRDTAFVVVYFRSIYYGSTSSTF